MLINPSRPPDMAYGYKCCSTLFTHSMRMHACRAMAHQQGEQLPPPGCLTRLLEAFVVNVDWQVAAEAVLFPPDALLIRL